MSFGLLKFHRTGAEAVLDQRPRTCPDGVASADLSTFPAGERRRRPQRP